jgi:uncharacterized caspase-like protein
MRRHFFFISIWVVGLWGCPGIQYTETVTPVSLSPDKIKVEARVLAKAEDWKNSSVIVEKGKRYTIQARGKWRTGGTCNWTGPDGVGLYGPLCWDLGGQIVRGWSHAALIGRIGESGAPFAVGDSLDLSPEESGTLYLRINEKQGFLGDNEGHVDVTVLAGWEPGIGATPKRLAVTIKYPPDASVLDREEISFICTVESEHPISELRITINGKPLPPSRGTSSADVKGRRSVPIETSLPLEAGQNVIAVSASDEAGNTEQKIVTVKREAGSQTAAAPAPVAPKPTKAEGIRGQRWAVVVGISRYQNAHDIPNLRYADRDASAMYEFLRSPQGGGYPESHVKLLLNENATYLALRDALFTFLQRAIAEDLVIVYISGHGAPDPKNQKNLYFLAYDTDVSRMASTAFPMWDLETAVQRQIAAQKVVIITDTCHSGAVGGGIGTRALDSRDNLINKYLLGIAQAKRGVAVLTASEAGERSLESENWGGGHGVFTHYLLKGLRGEADHNGDGVVSLGEVMDYTSENVRRDTNSQQHPDTAGMFDRNLPMAVLK